MIKLILSLVIALLSLVLKWFGYFIVVGVILTWGSVSRSAVLAALAVAFLYFTFRAPTVCLAITRQGQLCRNNALGLMMGCHLREHKWQKWRLAVVPHSWRELGRWLGKQPRLPLIGATSAAVAALATGVQAVSSVVWHT